MRDRPDAGADGRISNAWIKLTRSRIKRAAWSLRIDLAGSRVDRTTGSLRINFPGSRVENARGGSWRSCAWRLDHGFAGKGDMGSEQKEYAICKAQDNILTQRSHETCAPFLTAVA